MTDLSIKTLRTMDYFITAADEIIQEFGIERATVRNIAKRAGYNSSTIYNYFNSLEHLIFFTKISHLEEYTERLYNEISDDLHPLDQFVKIWRIFSEEAFKNPNDFYDLFFSKFSFELSDSLALYYKIYPERLNTSNTRLKAMLNEKDIYKRNMTLMNDCIENGCFINIKDAKRINELMILTFRGLLDMFLETKSKDIQGYTDHFMKYLDILLTLELKNKKDLSSD